VLKICLPSEAASPDQIWQRLSTKVQGTAVEPSQDHISPLTDWPKVRKFYKLNGLAWLDKMDAASKLKESEMLVLGAMALRGL